MVSVVMAATMHVLLAIAVEQIPPVYDEKLALIAMQDAVSSYAGYNMDARFANVSSLNCSSQHCSLRSSLNVSFLQHREILNGVVTAGMVARDNQDGSIVVAFAGASMMGNGVLDWFLQPGTFKLANYSLSTCPQTIKVDEEILHYYTILRKDMIDLLQAYSADNSEDENIILRISGYSQGSVYAPLAALDIQAMITSGLLPSNFKLGPVYSAGILAMFDSNFLDCYTRNIANVTGHFSIHHGRDPTGYQMQDQYGWSMLAPRVFYDGPGGNLTSWDTNNYTVCPSASQGCDSKYAHDEKNQMIKDFCDFHMFYGGLDARAVYCQSTAANSMCTKSGVYLLCKNRII